MMKLKEICPWLKQEEDQTIKSYYILTAQWNNNEMKVY